MSEKGKIVLAYIFGWIGGLIVLFGIKDNEKNTKLHAAQAIVMSVAYWIIVVIYNTLPIYIPFFGNVLWIAYIALVIIGITKSGNTENPEIPVVGNIAKSIFDKKINE